MILKIIKTGFFVLCFIVLFFACKKDEIEVLQDKVSGEYEYFTCSTYIQIINNRLSNIRVSECDSLTKKILVVSKSNKENFITISFENFTKELYLEADGTFKSLIDDAYSHGSSYDEGQFYDQDSIKIIDYDGSPYRANITYYGKKIK